MILIIADHTGIWHVKSLIRQEYQDQLAVLEWNNEHGPDLVLKENLNLYETIVVAYQDIRSSDLVVEWLLHRITDEESQKVLNFYRIYNILIPVTNLDRVMTRDPEAHFKGMILGISHACMGIRAEMFDEPFCNLALHSQDLYYNMVSMKRCMEKYPNQIRDMQYLIIDLFDYNYFNYDTSRSSYETAVNYYSAGGICDDLHHIDLNKNMKYTPQQLFHSFELERWGDVTPSQVRNWSCLFTEKRLSAEYEHSFSDISAYRVSELFRKVETSEVQRFGQGLGTLDKVHEDTIRENVACLKEILHMAYELNPEISVWGILMPRYSEARRLIQPITDPWKERFMNCLEEVGEIYDFHFVDCTEHECADRPELYYDAVHFNYLGAAEFTVFLNNLIHRRCEE